MSINLNCFLGLAVLMGLLLDIDIQQVSGHFSKMFSTFCWFAVFFSMHKTFSVFRTNWNKVAHVVNRSFMKMVTMLHLLLKSKDGWRLLHLKASFYVNTRRENLKLDESCSLDVNQIYTIKKSAYFEIFYFVNKMDTSIFTFSSSPEPLG